MSRPVCFDETISKAESIRYLNKHREDIKLLRSETHFNVDEIENLYIIHYKIIKKGGPITQLRFHDIACTLFGITGDQFYEKIFAQFDPKSKGYIAPYQWIIILSVLLRGTLEEQIDFVWGVYAPQRDGFISRELMLHFMREAIIKGKNDTGYESMCKDITTLILKKFDLSLEGKISYENYRNGVKKNPLLLECLGPCLPKPQYVVAFLETFSVKKAELRCFPLSSESIPAETKVIFSSPYKKYKSN